MEGWVFQFYTIINKETYDWKKGEIPLSEDIVEIISSTNDIDAIVLYFPLYSTTISFTLQQAKEKDIGIDLYKFYDGIDLLKNYLPQNNKSGCRFTDYSSLNIRQLYSSDETLHNAIDSIRYGDYCAINKDFYDALVQQKIIEDKRK